MVDDYPVFNSYLMIKEKDDKDFFKEFTSTQLFQIFIQNSLCKGKDRTTHFDDIFQTFTKLKNKGNSTSFIYKKCYGEFIKEYKSFFKIKYNYIIKPFFIKKFKDLEEQFKNKNKDMKLSNIITFLSNQYEKKEDKNINAHGVLKENRRIMERPIELSNDCDPKEFYFFVIPDKNIIKKNTNNSIQIRRSKKIKIGIIENDNKDNNIKINKYISNAQNELTEDEMDDIRDNIREIMTRIYRSDLSKLEQDKKTIMNAMNSQYGRNYFLTVLNSGNINNRAMKILIEQSYDFLSHVIFNTLLNILKLEENDENYKCAIKLLKMSLCIKTVKNKKEIVLSDDLFEKLEDYSFFNKIQFWKLWIEDDLTKSDLEVLTTHNNLKAESEFYYIDEEDEEYQLYLKHSYDIFENLTSIMIKMKLKNSFIISNIPILIQEYIISEKDYNKLMHEVVNELKLFQQFSQ